MNSTKYELLDFENHAELVLALKKIVSKSENWSDLTAPHSASIDMIIRAISWILSGESDSTEYWDEIILYSELARSFAEKKLIDED